MLLFSLLLVDNKLLRGSLVNNFIMYAEDYEPKIKYECPSSTEINLAKWNKF